LNSFVLLVIGVLLAMLLVAVGSAVYHGWQMQRLKRHRRIVPHRLQQRYRKETQFALFMVLGAGIGLAIASMLR
jgi:hypothetical protein